MSKNNNKETKSSVFKNLINELKGTFNKEIKEDLTDVKIGNEYKKRPKDNKEVVKDQLKNLKI